MACTKGLHVREEMIDRAYHGGLIGFLQRWSQKKSIDRVKKKDPSPVLRGCPSSLSSSPSQKLILREPINPSKEVSHA
jgi:hypothetical protein